MRSCRSAAAAAVVTAAAAAALSGRGPEAVHRPARAVPPPRAVAREVYLMGTRAALATYDPSRAAALARLARLLGALEAAEHELSTWRPETPMSRLNRHPLGAPFVLPRAACEELAQVFRWHEATGGAFDPTVGHDRAVWGLHHLRLDERTCTVVRTAAVTVDTGGYGKGAALDRAARATAGEGAAWSIDLGGQVMVAGAPPGTDGWEILVAHPAHRDTALFALRLREGSLATSGGSERDRVVRGVRVGHILDPHTGRSASFVGSVTVWHPSGLAADILSTALYVMGPDAGRAWADAHGVAAFYAWSSDNAPGRVVVRASRAFLQRFPAVRQVAAPGGEASHGPDGLPISK